jgi:hypothetical protein
MKSEARDPKSERSPKTQIPKGAPSEMEFLRSEFRFGFCLGFRISDRGVLFT